MIVREKSNACPLYLYLIDSVLILEQELYLYTGTENIPGPEMLIYWCGFQSFYLRLYLFLTFTATKAACEMFAKSQNPHTVAELRQALEECSKYHGQLTRDAAMGIILQLL